MDTTRIDRHRCGAPLFDSDWSTLCQTLCAKNVGINKLGERTTLLWKLSEKTRAGEL